jgi:hypothetical protein
VFDIARFQFRAINTFSDFGELSGETRRKGAIEASYRTDIRITD